MWNEFIEQEKKKDETIEKWQEKQKKKLQSVVQPQNI